MPAKRKSPFVTCKAIIAYDGGAYAGWQRQDNGVSVQQRIEEALARLYGEPVPVAGAGRTDAGVHALGMPVSFKVKARHSIPTLLRAMNALLPDDIRVRRITRVAPGFHARFSAKRKLYLYRIHNTPVSDPFRRRVAWFLHKPLDAHAMEQAARHFVGKKDFSSVAVNPGYERTTMVRRVTCCKVRKRCDEIHVAVEADGFLYKMVRSIVGTLVEVGTGKRKASSIPAMLEAKKRGQGGVCAPAHGLFLVRVKY